MPLGSVWHLTGPTLAKPVENMQMQTLADAPVSGALGLLLLGRYTSSQAVMELENLRREPW